MDARLELLGKSQWRLLVRDRPCRFGYGHLDGRHDLDMHGGPAEVPDERALALFAAPSRVDERSRRVGRVLELHPAAELHPEGPTGGRRGHGERRVRRDARVAPRPVDRVGAQADARQPGRASRRGQPLVRLLVHAVLRHRVADHALRDVDTVFVAVGGGRARVGEPAQSSRRRTASNTFTVPTTLTCAERTGSHAQAG